MAVIRFAAYSFITSMPVLSFMLFISSRFENMWVPLGIGVAGFLSGMALANSDMDILSGTPVCCDAETSGCHECTAGRDGDHGFSGGNSVVPCCQSVDGKNSSL